MAFCTKCGKQLDLDARFCPGCGAPAHPSAQTIPEPRKEAWEGAIHKCPHCGAPVGSFDVHCPTCGNELRDKEAADSVAELSDRLDKIESERNKGGKKKGFFARAAEQSAISDIDQRKISLIRTYPIPNTVEDILEFVILASSNVEPEAYSISSASISGKAVSEAWITKCNQAIHKAEVSFNDSPLIDDMRKMRTDTLRSIRTAKLKGILSLTVLIAGPLLLAAIVGILSMLTEPGRTSEEIGRLEKVVDSIEQDLENGEYYRALLNAESLDASEYVSEEVQRQWDVNREYWIDRVLDEASESGIDLSTKAPEIDGEMQNPEEDSAAGFVGGFLDGLQSGQEEIQENVEEFNRIMSGS